MSSRFISGFLGAERISPDQPCYRIGYMDGTGNDDSGAGEMV